MTTICANGDYLYEEEDEWDEPCQDHDWEARYCDRCGLYQGMVCNHCGEWSDGGDHMAAQPALWCRCGENER